MADNLKILIVEDEIRIRDYFETLIRKKFTSLISTAKDGKEGLEYIKNEVFDIIITDLKMPEIGGLEILAAAKKKDKFTEVIIITGYASIETASGAINSGAISYMLKPVSVGDLIAQLEKATAQRLFHLKSSRLIKAVSASNIQEKDYIIDIKNLLDFSEQLSRMIGYKEIIQEIIMHLQETISSPLAMLLINNDTERALYVGGIARDTRVKGFEQIRNKIVNEWREKAPFENRKRELNPMDLRVNVIPSQIEIDELPDNLYLSSIPISVMGTTMAMICIASENRNYAKDDVLQYLYLVTNLIGPVLSNSYIYHSTNLLATRDGLTGILNHRSFHNAFDKELSRARRNKTILAFFIFDIDNFKLVNDTRGHQSGDTVLIGLAQTITNAIRSHDIFCRYGGEEFVLLLPDCNKKDALATGERLREAIAKEFFIDTNGNSFHITVSMGLNFYEEGEYDKGEIIKGADEALYKAKDSGKNCIVKAEDLK